MYIYVPVYMHKFIYMCVHIYVYVFEIIHKLSPSLLEHQIPGGVTGNQTQTHTQSIKYREV